MRLLMFLLQWIRKGEEMQDEDSNHFDMYLNILLEYVKSLSSSLKETSYTTQLCLVEVLL